VTPFLWGNDFCHLQLPLFGIFIFYQVVEEVVFDGIGRVGAAAAPSLSSLID